MFDYAAQRKFSKLSGIRWIRAFEEKMLAALLEIFESIYINISFVT